MGNFKQNEPFGFAKIKYSTGYIEEGLFVKGRPS